MDDEYEFDVMYDSDGTVTAHAPNLFKPLGRIEERADGWWSWDDRGKQVLERPGRAREDAIKSLVTWGGLGRSPYSITTS